MRAQRVQQRLFEEACLGDARAGTLVARSGRRETFEAIARGERRARGVGRRVEVHVRIVPDEDERNVAAV